MSHGAMLVVAEFSFTKFHLEGAELIHSDGQMDVTEQIHPLHENADVPKSVEFKT
jgi:hypothetical protein